MVKQQKKGFPIGIDDFKTLIEGSYFVDKTKLIKEILDNYTIQVSLITRPRRFGKSLLLSMLRYFFTIEDAENNRKLFCGLEIERSHSKYMDFQGKFPMIFFSLKGVKQQTFEMFIRKMRYYWQKFIQIFPISGQVAY